MKRQFVLVHSEARRRAMACVADAPEGYVVTVREPIKSREQEEKYHAMIGEIAAAFRYNGKQLDAETMKRLLIDQFKAETYTDPELREYWLRLGDLQMMPSLDGQRIIVLGAQSRHFPKPLARSFITWLEAWGAEHCTQEQEHA